MNPYQITIWILVGSCLAMINFVTQYWSVKIIAPEKYYLSQWLIIGGAVFRWALICLILGLALSSSFSATLIVFIAFWVARLVLLKTLSTRWQNAQLKRQ